MRYDLMDSTQYLNELGRQAWIRGEPTAPLLAALADRAEEAEGEPGRIEKAFEEGKAEGRKEAIEALLGDLAPVIEAFEELAYGKGAIKKAEFVALFEELDKAVQEAE